MTLRYTNNSPDTLRFIWFQVEQNAFKNNSLNSFVFPPNRASARATSRAATSSIGSIRSTADGEKTALEDARRTAR